MAQVIALTPCDSKMLAAHGYDPVSRTLAVRFQTGGTYHYIDVPPEVYEAFRGAESVGRFFHTSIRGKFESTRMPA